MNAPDLQLSEHRFSGFYRALRAEVARRLERPGGELEIDHGVDLYLRSEIYAIAKMLPILFRVDIEHRETEQDRRRLQRSQLRVVA